MRALGEAGHAAALAGDLHTASRALEQLHLEAHAESHAWSLAIRAAASMLWPAAFDAPSLREIAGSLHAPLGSRRAARLALVECVRRAVLAFDADELGTCIDLYERSLTPQEPEPGALLWLESARAWHALGRGQLTNLENELERVQREALALKIAPLVVEATAQRSIAAIMAGELAAGTDLARRASRMARTEALPQQEFLAHLVLARARRSNRQPHLASRILNALAQVVAPAWLPWVTWELSLAGELTRSPPAANRLQASRASRAARALTELQQSASAGDRAAFDGSVSALQGAAAGWAIVEREATRLIAALDFQSVEGSTDAELAAWQSGERTLPPPEIYGACTVGARAGDDDDGSEAYVLARPNAPPRRVLGLGAALIDLPGLIRLRRTRRRQGRVETVAAVIAAAGTDGIDLIACFERAYEIAWEAEVHRGVFEVLLHRLRTYLEGTAELVRHGGKLSLELHCPVLVPDPRCARPVFDRLLRVLARDGRLTAAEAATKTGLSVRAAQDALKALAADGACSFEKEGRQLLYIVEDTTFSEPTRRLVQPQ
jgi:hypothetical protein